VTGGLDFRISPRNQLATYRSDPYQLYADARPSFGNHGLFLQDEITLHPKLRVNAGVRYDRYTTFGATLNPRAGLIFSASSYSW
jgi:iron complex outermembrane receptor protein